MTGTRVRTCLLFLLLSAYAGGNAGAGVFDTLSSAGKDKYVHFCAGTVISHASYPLFRSTLRNKESAWLYSLGLAALASAGKELSDAGGSGFSGSDLLAGVAGGATILVVRF